MHVTTNLPACSTLMIALVCCASMALNAGRALADFAEEQSAAPRIVFETNTHDFGAVNKNSVLTHVFAFENTGSAPLKILQTDSECTCTTVMASPQEIPPGESGAIEVMYSPGTKLGPHIETVHVRTNDPDNRNIQLSLHTTVEVFLAINPDTIRFEPFTRAGGSTRPLYAGITGNESDTVHILSVASASDFINVEINQKGFDGDTDKTIRFSMMPGMETGRFRERVVFTTDSQQMPVIKVFVMGEVIGNISVTPRHLPFGMLDPGIQADRTITLAAVRDGFEFRVLEINSTVDGIITDLKTVTPGREYRVTVSVPRGFDQPVLRGEVRITTDDPEQRTIPVRIFGRLAPAPRQDSPVRPQRTGAADTTAEEAE